MRLIACNSSKLRRAWAGYAGGNADTANYDRVSEGDTGHAESVKVLYDPRQVSYGQLLKLRAIEQIAPLASPQTSIAISELLP